MTRRIVLCLAIAACGGGGDDPAPADTAAATDAPAQVATVMTVVCDGTESATTSSEAQFAFDPPNVTISVGQVVKFISGSVHNVIPGAAPTDSGLRLPTKGATGCLKFTAAGTFNFKCEPHPSMKGSVTVN